MSLVPCSGISAIDSAAIERARAAGERWKLIGSARREAGGSVRASVEAKLLPGHHPLAGILGATNALAFDTELLGAVTVSGPGAGRIETAFALLSDIVAIHTAGHSA